MMQALCMESTQRAHREEHTRIDHGLFLCTRHVIKGQADYVHRWPIPLLG